MSKYVPTIMVALSDDGKNYNGKFVEKKIFGELKIGEHLFYFTKNSHIWSEKKCGYMERLVLTCEKTTRKLPNVHGITKKAVMVSLLKEYGSLKKLEQKLNKYFEVKNHD